MLKSPSKFTHFDVHISMLKKTGLGVLVLHQWGHSESRFHRCSHYHATLGVTLAAKAFSKNLKLVFQVSKQPFTRLFVFPSFRSSLHFGDMAPERNLVRLVRHLYRNHIRKLCTCPEEFRDLSMGSNWIGSPALNQVQCKVTSYPTQLSKFQIPASIWGMI